MENSRISPVILHYLEILSGESSTKTLRYFGFNEVAIKKMLTEPIEGLTPIPGKHNILYKNYILVLMCVCSPHVFVFFIFLTEDAYISLCEILDSEVAGKMQLF